MTALKDAEEVIKDISIDIIEENKEVIISQAVLLCNKLNDEVKQFDNKKEYAYIYKDFIESIDKKYRFLFSYILDFSVRLLVNEIYITIEIPNDVDLSSIALKEIPAKNKKHFQTAKKIAEKLIKKYYFSKCADKLMINYIDDLIPEDYGNEEDLDYLIWYFLICIVSYNHKVCNS